MERGFYIAATGMMLQRRKMENVTNNITNVETLGYKKDHLVSHTFDDVLIERINDPNTVAVTPYRRLTVRNNEVGPLNWGTQVDTIHTNFETGHFEETGLPTDMALAGDVFFVVTTDEGDRFTRAGSFVINGEGYLTDPEGHYLQGNDGSRIYVGGDDFEVDTGGNVFTGDGQYSNTLRLVSFEDNANLRKQGSNLYYLNEGEPQAPGAFSVKHRFLENSNVEVAREMVDMISLYRAYETSQRALTMIDETIGKAVNEIGIVR